VFDDGVAVTLGPTVKSCDWTAVMSDTSFWLCAPTEGVWFEPYHDLWSVSIGDVLAIREALRMASLWFRKEWKPDFTRMRPFGIDRKIAVRRADNRITIRIPGMPVGDRPCPALEFHYIELPRLRGAIESIIAGRGRRTVTKRPEGDSHGKGCLHPD